MTNITLKLRHSRGTLDFHLQTLSQCSICDKDKRTATVFSRCDKGQTPSTVFNNCGKGQTGASALRLRWGSQVQHCHSVSHVAKGPDTRRLLLLVTVDCKTSHSWQSTLDLLELSGTARERFYSRFWGGRRPHKITPTMTVDNDNKVCGWHTVTEFNPDWIKAATAR